MQISTKKAFLKLNNNSNREQIIYARNFIWNIQTSDNLNQDWGKYELAANISLL